MFTKISKAGIGMYVVVITSTLTYFGFNLDSGIATEAVLAILNGVGGILWIIGQFMRKDISFGIFRKEQ